jgi:hypothetical protein
MAGRVQHPGHPFGDLGAIGDLRDHADLHVVDDQGQALGVTDLFQTLGDAKLAVMLHASRDRRA